MSICWNLPGQMKKIVKNRLKNLWNWRIILMPATVWQIFHTKRVHLFGAYAMTGNYVNLRKRLVKTCEITAFKWNYFKRFLAVWNHCGELPFGLFFLLGLRRLVWQCYQFWSFVIIVSFSSCGATCGGQGQPFVMAKAYIIITKFWKLCHPFVDDEKKLHFDENVSNWKFT